MSIMWGFSRSWLFFEILKLFAIENDINLLLVVELFICRDHKNSAFNDLTLHKTTLLLKSSALYQLVTALIPACDCF